MSQSARYMLKDHLGSVTAILDENGVVQERLSFDAYGRRRTDSGANIPEIDFFSLNPLTNRGYTGHEHVDGVGLIHMNGRVYDPTIARFLSADPIIQAPTNLQSLNRYSYVVNNPLRYTDPSGYSWLSREWKRTKKRATRLRDSFKGFVVAGIPGAFAGYNYRKARDLGFSVSQSQKMGAISGATTGAAMGIGLYFGGPAGALKAAGMTYTMQTPTARSATRSVSNELFYEFIGIHDNGVNDFLASALVGSGVSYTGGIAYDGYSGFMRGGSAMGALKSMAGDVFSDVGNIFSPGGRFDGQRYLAELSALFMDEADARGTVNYFFPEVWKNVAGLSERQFMMAQNMYFDAWNLNFGFKDLQSVMGKGVFTSNVSRGQGGLFSSASLFKISLILNPAETYSEVLTRMQPGLATRAGIWTKYGSAVKGY